MKLKLTLFLIVVSIVNLLSQTVYNNFDDSAQFVRVVGHGNSGSMWNSYTEFEVWGWPKANVGLNSNNYNSIAIYPNPCNGTFAIKTEECKKITIFSTDGKLVMSKTVNDKNPILHTDLNAGIYLLVVETNKKQMQTKLVVQ